MVNLGKFMKEAQNMQKKMAEMQEQMAGAEYTGKAGGGLVNVTLTGAGEVRSVSIDPSLIKVEEKEMLEDLLVAAFSDAKNKVDENSQSSMANALGNLPLPPGFKFPF